MNIEKIANRIAISLEVFPSKEEYKGEYMSIQKRNGFEFAHRNSGIQYTAMIPFVKEDDTLYTYVRMEPRLTHYETCVLVPSCVTGSVEEGETPLENAMKELAEEIGFYANRNRWFYVGEFWTSKVTDEVCYAYIVDVTGLKQEETSGDGSRFEKLSNSMKLKLDKAAKVVYDSMFHVILSKMELNNKASGKPISNT